MRRNSNGRSVTLEILVVFAYHGLAGSNSGRHRGSNDMRRHLPRIIRKERIAGWVGALTYRNRLGVALVILVVGTVAGSTLFDGRHLNFEFHAHCRCTTSASDLTFAA